MPLRITSNLVFEDISKLQWVISALTMTPSRASKATTATELGREKKSAREGRGNSLHSSTWDTV